MPAAQRLDSQRTRTQMALSLNLDIGSPCDGQPAPVGTNQEERSRDRLARTLASRKTMGLSVAIQVGFKVGADLRDHGAHHGIVEPLELTDRDAVMRADLHCPDLA